MNPSRARCYICPWLVKVVGLGALPQTGVGRVAGEKNSVGWVSINSARGRKLGGSYADQQCEARYSPSALP
jgi:hypothetical protein